MSAANERKNSRRPLLSLTDSLSTFHVYVQQQQSDQTPVVTKNTVSESIGRRRLSLVYIFSRVVSVHALSSLRTFIFNRHSAIWPHVLVWVSDISESLHFGGDKNSSFLNANCCNHSALAAGVAAGDVTDNASTTCWWRCNYYNRQNDRQIGVNAISPSFTQRI